MQWSVFVLILMGECSFCVCQFYEYTFVNKNMNWSEAQNYCRQKHTDLATVYDMTDMNRLCDTAKKDDQAWIGLHTIPGKNKIWHWSLPGVEFKKVAWKPNEPNGDKNEFCAVVFSADHTWLDQQCDKDFDFICYETKGSKNNFHEINIKMNWSQAQSYCRENHTDLISGFSQLKDLKEQNKIDPQSSMWIGLFRDTWTWSDSSSSSFRNFGKFEGGDSETCASVFPKSGKWSSDNCDDKKPFFCYDDKVILIQQNKTWDEALEYCRQHHKDLVSITKLRDQRWVQDRAKKASSPFVWLGLRYTCTLEFWFWVSDETVSYNYWASAVVKDDCDMSGAMERGGRYEWYKKDDNDKFNFICSKF